MKRLSFLFSVASIAAVSFLSSCKKDDKIDPKPAASISAYIGTSGTTSKTLADGDKATITYDANSGEKLSKLEVIKRKGGSTTNVIGFPKTSGFTSNTNDKNTVEVTSDGTEVFYDFKVTDAVGSTSTTTITLNPAGAAMTFSSYTQKLLGAQDNNAGAYFASSNGTVYSGLLFEANKNIIDITYAEIGATTTKPTLLSSVQRSTEGLTKGTGGTATYFKMSSLNFATVTDGQLASINASTVQKVEPSINGTYEFVNSAGKKGLINVSSITMGTNSTKTDGSITINVKVQK